MEENIVRVLIAAVILTLFAIPASADLMPMSWGFPQMIQNSSLTSLQNNFAWATDFEFTDISFPTAGTSTFGLSTFPTITQTINKNQVVSSFSFTHQQESMQFSYPWMSTGFSPVPSMGFL